jgi:hypothetical protein
MPEKIRFISKIRLFLSNLILARNGVLGNFLFNFSLPQKLSRFSFAQKKSGGKEKRPPSS